MSSPLVKAVKRGDLVSARRLLKGGADANEGTRGVSLPLWEAAHRGHTPMVTLLLEAGARTTWEVVHAAAFKNHANTLRVLLAAGAPADPLDGAIPLLNQLDYSGFTREQQSGVRQLLQDAGARELPAGVNIVAPVTAPVSRWRWLLPALTAATSALALAMFAAGFASGLEAVSFVTGAVCVWLTVRESVWNFPIGMVNVATFAVVFFRARLYADAGLQVVYFALGGIGWYLWLYGGAGRTVLPITRTPSRRAAGVAVAMLVMFAGEYALLRRIGGASPLWDALTTAISLGAQWLLDRKHVENWILWIAVDVIYVPLYLSKQLYLTSCLYAVFLCMATLGLLRWHAIWRTRTAPVAHT